MDNYSLSSTARGFLLGLRVSARWDNNHRSFVTHTPVGNTNTIFLSSSNNTVHQF